MTFTPYTVEFFLKYPFVGNYLEIGVYCGEGIGRMAKGLPGKTIIAVDPFIEDGNTSHHSGVESGDKLKSQRELTLQEIAGLSNVKLNEVTSEDFYKSLTPEKIAELNVGAVYIDGSHWYKDVIIDCKLAMDLIGDKPGVICFDDMHITGVVQAIGEFVGLYESRITKMDSYSLFNQMIVYVNQLPVAMPVVSNQKDNAAGQKIIQRRPVISRIKGAIKLLLLGY